MRRYICILRLQIVLSLATEMHYRMNFVLGAVAAILGMIVNIISISLFYRNGYTFSGWTWHESLIVLGFFTTITGFSSIFLDPNLSEMVKHVQRGTLDFVLLKPVDSQFWISSSRFSPWGVPDLILGTALVVYGGLDSNISVRNYISGYGLFLLGVIVLYNLWFILGATTIWFVKTNNASEVIRHVLEAGKYPSSGFPPAYRFVFTFIVPVVFLTTVPSEVMLGRSSPGWIVGSVVLVVLLTLATRKFWYFALRYYSSASS